MIQLFNKLIKRYLKYRFPRIEYFKKHPLEAQSAVLTRILEKNGDCTYLKPYSIAGSMTTYRECVPIIEYNTLSPLIEKMMLGEADLLVPAKVYWYAKSSGTSNTVSKYIPTTDDILLNGHYKSSWDVVTLAYHDNPDARIFADKNLIMGGSVQTFEANPAVRFGDISGILLTNMPSVGRPFYTPDFETALLSDWELKIKRMVYQCSHEPVVTFGGVPTWTTVLFDAMLDYTGKSTMRDIWPEATTYLHGGVSFEPYRTRFSQYFPDDKLNYREVYNASEGYFALQDDGQSHDMLLLLDNAVYYEFVPFSQYGDPDPDILTLADVQLGVPYAMVITNSSGLWRYVIGDVVEFTALYPFKIIITGRTEHYINVFGEEVMVQNTDKALNIVCQALACSIRDYTIGPIFIEEGKKGGHEWAIEFEDEPSNIDIFSRKLDEALRSVNSDYDAKRTKDMALQALKVNAVTKRTFNTWLAQKGKLGGQYKVPRLHNSRKYLDEILAVNYHSS